MTVAGNLLKSLNEREEVGGSGGNERDFYGEEEYGVEPVRRFPTELESRRFRDRNTRMRTEKRTIHKDGKSQAIITE